MSFNLEGLESAGHFLLTEMLLEKMIETAEKTGVAGRIINVSSVIHSWVKRDAFRFHDMLNGTKYTLSNLILNTKLFIRWLILCIILLNKSNCIIISILIAVIMVHEHILNQNWRIFCMRRSWPGS